MKKHTRLPVIDIHTVGAGGGSIAAVDSGGALRVGPESAGADPGPVCYGIGEELTVTDANLLLGRLDPGFFLGGRMSLDLERTGRVARVVAKRLKLTVPELSEGIVRVANANIERAIRAVSVERGYDPREFALLAFGGAGGLHACEIAADMGIRTVLVPQLAGALSALGMLLAERMRDYSASALGRADHREVFQNLDSQARADLPGCRLEHSADLRYEGQPMELKEAKPLPSSD